MSADKVKINNRNHFPSVNRALLVITPKQAYVDWANSLQKYESPERDEPLSLEDIISGEPTTYLIPEPQSQNNFEWVEINWAMLFDLQLEGWSLNKESWPEKRTKKMFKEWFNISVSSLVLDLAEDEILEHDVY